MPRDTHWDDVYDTKDPGRVSWYAPHLERSLELIAAANLPPTASIIDVGGGVSSLPGDLLDQGFRDVTVLDVSASAVQRARDGLGERASTVRWIVSDVTTAELDEGAYDLWHDRAVFHFLTDEDDRAAYIRQVSRALRPGGRIIVATFGLEGPEKCSGLPVVRYDDASLVRQFGAVFERLECLHDTHETPWGSAQDFVYCLCRRVAEADA